jgi:hypothetical protein
MRLNFYVYEGERKEGIPWLPERNNMLRFLWEKEQAEIFMGKRTG